MAGIEATLRRGRALGGVGTFLLATLSIGQIAFAIYESTMVAGAGKLDLQHLPREWPLWTGSGFLVLLIAFWTWSRFWLRESKQAFRYTYSIEPFVALDTPAANLKWLTTDISRRLSERIRRLTLLDDALARIDPNSDQSHIHISGSYGLRDQRRGNGARRWQIEVLPWIRIGQPDSPARLAHRVTYSSSDWDPDSKPSVANLPPDDYDKLVERVYFSIATEIYKQIRQDVQRKIDLLPGRRFRATAYFYEAEDYVRSNTLDAYADAVELYRRVIELYDPEWIELPRTTWRKLIKLSERQLAAIARRVRIQGSLYWPSMARVQLMVARAYLGYANAQIYQHILATLSGQRVNAVFETRPAVKKAIRRLEPLPAHIEGLRDAKFDALVTKALADSVLSARIDAFDDLALARASEPLKAEQDSRYLFVRGYLEPDIIQSLRFLRRAVDLDPEYEVAQFELARATELLWRTRPRLERGVAESPIKEYERVVDLNPGNIAAWASLAYVNWLLEDQERAKQLYERGLEYKEIKRATFVAQLDYGLARISAEAGDFREAYRHYIDAVSAEMVQGVSHGPQDEDRDVTFIGDNMLVRFAAYGKRVEQHWRAAAEVAALQDEARIRDSVLGFVLTDCGKAWFAHYVRTGDNESLKQAQEALDRASEQKHGSRFVLTHFHQHLLNAPWVDPDAWRDYLGEHILTVDSLDPNWVDGNLELLGFFAAKCDAMLAQWVDSYRASAEAEASAAAKRSYADRLRAGSVGYGSGFRADQRSTQSSALNAEQGGEADAREDTASREAELATEFESKASAIQSDWVPGALIASRSTRDHWRRRMEEWTDAIDAAAKHSAAAAIAHAEAEKSALLGSDPLRAEQKARDLEREAGEADFDMGVHGARADTAKDNLLEFVDRVPKRMQNVLPHAALRKNGQVSLESFARSRSGELKWERTFNDLHVRALRAWSKSQSIDVELQTLLHIRSHFQPQESDLIVRCLDIKTSNDDMRKKYRASIQSDRQTWARILESWLEGEPEYWRLTWILPGEAEVDPIFDQQHVIELLVGASKRRNVTPALLLNIGHWLEPPAAKEALRIYALLREQLRTTDRGDLMFALAERFDALGKVDESIQCYRLASEMPCRTGEAELNAECHMRIAQLEWKRSNDISMLAELDSLSLSNVAPGWRSRMMEEVKQTPRSSPMLRIWLDHEQRCSRDRPRETIVDIVAALTTLLQVERDLYAASHPDEYMMRPIPTPIALEAHPEFFPQEADTPQVVRMLGDSGLDEMRERLRRRYGVRLPGVRIWPNPNLHNGTYRILVHEVPRAWGATDPGGDYDGTLISAVEQCLSENIDAFVGVQETGDLVEQWRRQDTASGLAYPPSASSAARGVLLAEVLRGLVRDQICLEPLDDLIHGFVESLDTDVDRTMMRMRASLSPKRLGFRTDAPMGRLPYELERQAIKLTQSKVNGAAANRQSVEQRLRQRLLDCIAPEQAMLVVRVPSIRATVRGLIRGNLPHLVVLTQEEIAGREMDSYGGATRIS